MLILKIPLGREVHSTDEETVNTFLRWRNRKGRASECQLAHWRAGAVRSTHSSSLCLTWANTNFDCFELSFPLLPFSPFLFSFSFLPTSTFFTSVGKLPSHDTDARHYDTQGGPRAPYLSAGSQASGGPTPFPLPWCHLKRQLHFSLGSFSGSQQGALLQNQKHKCRNPFTGPQTVKPSQHPHLETALIIQGRASSSPCNEYVSLRGTQQNPEALSAAPRQHVFQTLLESADFHVMSFFSRKKIH